MNQFPSDFIERVRAVSGEQFERVMLGYEVDRLASFRVNEIIVDEKEAIDRLRDIGFDVGRMSDKNAYILKNKSRREFTDLEEYKKGWYYLQSLSSMVPVWCIEDEVTALTAKGMDLMGLDLCAAPGSKTTQLAVVMENRGEIVANDSSRDRLFRLKDISRQYGATNIYMNLAHGENLWRKYGPVFDFVLVDAPCSGEGRFSLDDPSSYADWSLKKVERLAELQKKLLFSGIMCLKSGGSLVYSTCTMAPEENEEVVDYVLEKFEGAIEIEKVDAVVLNLKNSIFSQGVTEWQGKKLDGRVCQTLRIFPSEYWEGFFVCKIRRV